MESKKLALIHTSATLIPVFAQLCEKHLPDIATFNIVDESLIRNTIASNGLTPLTERRVINYAVSAEEAGADLILFTCSSIGPAAETAARLINTPVYRVDQPMADKAVQSGSRIGIAATLGTTLEPTADLINRRALISGKEIQLTTKLCNGAFEALMAGEAATHDSLVIETVLQLAKETDIVVLAQASMARIADVLKKEYPEVQVISSPETAISFLASVLRQ
jgi:Asp/Glu/hydantoin racemase